MRVIFGMLVLGTLIAVSACGSDDEVRPRDVAQSRSASTSRTAVAAATGSAAPFAPDEASRQLLDFGEARYPQYFPSHQPTQSYPPFLYRYYPETDIYLGVAVLDDMGFVSGNVYVKGGRFGNAPTSVGKLADFISVPRASSVSLLAGGLGGPGYTDGIGAAARFGRFAAGASVTVDPLGNVYLADASQHTIRKITPEGQVRTVAGTPGLAGHLDGSGPAARFNQPSCIALDAAGNLYVGERVGATLRKITPAGEVTTLAGRPEVYGSADGDWSVATFGLISAVAVDKSGAVLLTDGQGVIRRVSPEGFVSTLAGKANVFGSVDGVGENARFGELLKSIAVDPNGDALVVDSFHATIRKITPAGVVSTFIGAADKFGQIDGVGGAARINGAVTISMNNSGGMTIVQGTGSGSIAVRTASALGLVTTPLPDVAGLGVVADSHATPDGGIIVHSDWGTAVKKVASDGTVKLLAGSAAQTGLINAAGNAARFNRPLHTAVDLVGNAYVIDFQDGLAAIRKITPVGQVSTLAGGKGRGLADGVGSGATFSFPASITLDIQGNLWVLEGQAGYLRRVTPLGVVSTVADLGRLRDAEGFSSFVSAIAADAAGNIVVCELNTGLWRVSAAGAVTKIGAKNGCYRLVVDRLGTITVMKADGSMHRVAGDGSFVALAGSPGAPGFQDGPGATARFGDAGGFEDGAGQLAADSLGNVYFADRANAVIRRITPAGLVTTVAGVGRRSQVIEGAPGGLNQPTGLAVFESGSQVSLLVTDWAENSVLKVELP